MTSRLGKGEMNNFLQCIYSTAELARTLIDCGQIFYFRIFFWESGHKVGGGGGGFKLSFYVPHKNFNARSREIMGMGMNPLCKRRNIKKSSNAVATATE